MVNGVPGDALRLQKDTTSVAVTVHENKALYSLYALHKKQ